MPQLQQGTEMCEWGGGKGKGKAWVEAGLRDKAGIRSLQLSSPNTFTRWAAQWLQRFISGLLEVRGL